MNLLQTFKFSLILPVVCASLGCLTPSVRAGDAAPLQLLAAAPVSADGVFLPQIFTSTEPLPVVRLIEAPAFGKNLILTRAQICDLLAANAPGVGTNFSGPDAIKIYRRTRTLGESDILGMLTATLQHDYIKDKGQLDLRLAQPWTPLLLPDEPLSLDISELPTAGVTPNFIVRFSLHTGKETLGDWSANLKASVWREVWVSSAQLKRGDPVSADLVTRERRDVLTLHEPVADFVAGDESLEINESVPAGVPLMARMIRARAVVHRGQHAYALVEDATMSVRTQVDILDDGAPGETVHARNSITHRDLTGTVLNEHTILISL